MEEELEVLISQKSYDEAFRLVVKLYQERVYWHVRRMVGNHEDADDVVQNTMIKAWKGLSNFKGDAKLFTWLYRIATNEAITFINKRKMHVVADSEEILENIGGGTNESMSGDSIEGLLKRAIALLPEKQQLVFNMKYFDEMKYDEMSAVLETSVGALKASYHHAVKKIEEFLKSN